MSNFIKFWQGFIGFINKLFSINAHNDFVELFFIKEAQELSGNKYKNFIFIIIILFVTFTAIGFANGSLKYLGEKMNDPFVKFVDISIDRGKLQSIGQIQRELNKDSAAKKRYYYKEVIGYNKVYLRFSGNVKSGHKGTFIGTGRTINTEDPLLVDILGKRNLLEGRSFKNEMDLGIIVTQDFLEDLGYDEDVLFIPHIFPYDEESDTVFPIPIVAVIKELPGLNSFATTPYFYSQRYLSSGNPFSPVNTNDIILFTSADSSTVEYIREQIFNIVDNNKLISEYDPEVDISANNKAYKHGTNIRVTFFPKPSKEKLKKFSELILKENVLKDYNLLQIYDSKPTSNEVYDNYHVLSVHFNNLDNVRGFKEYLLKKYGLEIDMARIEALENYNFITKITRIISILLIGFSILSICLFVGNLLSKHLEKIHMNIGTFKAFGINDHTLQKIYLLLSYFFIISAMFIALIFSWIFGALKGAKLVLRIFNLPIEKSQSYFNLVDVWTLIAIVLTLIISYFVLNKNASKIIKRSPGDLIYSRI